MRLKEEFRLFFMTFRSLPNVEANTKAPRLFLQPFPFAPSFCTHRSLSKHFGAAEQDRQEYVPPVRRHAVLFPRVDDKMLCALKPLETFLLQGSLCLLAFNARLCYVILLAHCPTSAVSVWRMHTLDFSIEKDERIELPTCGNAQA